jgi:hypothetical protein
MVLREICHISDFFVVNDGGRCDFFYTCACNNHLLFWCSLIFFVSSVLVRCAANLHKFCTSNKLLIYLLHSVLLANVCVCLWKFIFFSNSPQGFRDVTICRSCMASETLQHGRNTASDDTPIFYLVFLHLSALELLYFNNNYFIFIIFYIKNCLLPGMGVFCIALHICGECEY